MRRELARACQGAHVEVRGQFVKVGSLIPLLGSWLQYRSSASAAGMRASHRLYKMKFALEQRIRNT